jgi:hypothetical protein
MQRKAKTQDQTKARAGKQGDLSLKPEGMGYEPGRLSLKQGKLSLEPGRLSSNSNTDIEQGRLL